MYNKGYALLAILLGSVALIPAYAQTPTITEQPDKPNYSAGDTIMITGKVTGVTGPLNQPLVIQVMDPQGNRARLDQVQAGADGSYTYSFPSGGPLMAKNGTYTVTVTYKGASQKATFQFAATGVQGGQWKMFTLNAGGKSYQIPYIITGGTVKGMTLDQNTSTLTVNASTTSNGTLQLRLPRNVIDAKAGSDGKSGADTSFAVFLDDAENVEPNESTPTADMRQISIDFPSGTAKIDVVGTTAVPEFGTIAAIVLGIAIIGIIIATTRYNNNNKFNFPRL
ncbi:MAG TPA: PEFG-CTERM sorting domain-containing protein [Nitrososphaera sp.]|nr:PEFG-CTERM sorting domain-containing protein [Nitrososphaera sp.]